MRDAATLCDLVGEVDRDGAGLDEVEGEVGDVARKQLAGEKRHRRGHVAGPDDDDVADYDVLPRLGELDVAARLGGQVDDDRPAAHALDHVGGDEKWRAAAGDGGGGDDHVGLGDGPPGGAEGWGSPAAPPRRLP